MPAVVTRAERAGGSLRGRSRPCWRATSQEGLHIGAQPEQVHRYDADGALGRRALPAWTSRLNVARSTSQKTGLRARYSTAFAVDIQVKAGTMTSSPGPSPSAATAMCKAVVQELAALHMAPRMNSENSASKRSTQGPWTTQPVCSGAFSASYSSWPNRGFEIGIMDVWRGGPP